MGKRPSIKTTKSTFLKQKPVASSSEKIPEETIRKLSEILKTTDLAEIEIRIGEMTVRVRAREEVVSHSVPSVNLVSATATIVPKVQKAPEAVSDLHIVRSPFIGTFYRSPSPSSPSFVELGQAVAKGQSLCIVEAMKLMNEIESDSAGIIEKIFVENGSPVEFNSALFGIRK
ncbi:MAG: biotin carboxyl carrier protein [Bacteriovoracaceae bacterium]|nr:biotin carboxyl carrier protein [Bacteriovoracaceae bacterium]